MRKIKFQIFRLKRGLLMLHKFMKISTGRSFEIKNNWWLHYPPSRFPPDENKIHFKDIEPLVVKNSLIKIPVKKHCVLSYLWFLHENNNKKKWEKKKLFVWFKKAWKFCMCFSFCINIFCSGNDTSVGAVIYDDDHHFNKLSLSLWRLPVENISRDKEYFIIK